VPTQSLNKIAGPSMQLHSVYFRRPPAPGPVDSWPPSPARRLNKDAPSIPIIAVEIGDRSSGLAIIRHLDKRESA
jgi:hypothetical protein